MLLLDENAIEDVFEDLARPMSTTHTSKPSSTVLVTITLRMKSHG